jgi:cardiolipin synthase A/B
LCNVSFLKKIRYAPLLVLAIASLLVGCGTIPNANAVLHTNPLYLVAPRFVGPHGSLTTEQAEHVIARLKENQQTPSDLLERHLAFEQALSDTPLVVGNQVTLLQNGPATYKAMIDAIHGARDNVNIGMYIFSDGQVGQMFADALMERQRHGVQVNVMYDSLGSFHTSASFFEKMQQTGIAVLPYRPLNPFAATLHWELSHRNHRKMLIVDGRIAFTGGINISEDYASGPSGSGEADDNQGSARSAQPAQSAQTAQSAQPAQNARTLLESWRDTDIKLEGPVVAQLQRIFLNEWYYQRGPPLSPRIYYPKLERKGGEIVRVISSVPERFSSIYVNTISAIANSQTNIYITDAYFAPDRQMLRQLEQAARRGVDVRLLLPSQTDAMLLLSAERSHYAGLLKSGIKIYEWRGKMLHAKTATIDGVWSTVGTSNLDWWSIARDNEVNVIILSHPFADQMNAMFDNDLKYASEITPDQWKGRGWRERLDEQFAGIVEPLL